MAENDKVEFKLPFRKTIVAPLVDILEIKKTNAWVRHEKYYQINYIGGKFNTYFMSTENMKQISKFISELEKRVEKAKIEIVN